MAEVRQEQQSLVAIEIIRLTLERHYLIRFEENCNSCTSRRKIILIRKKTKDLEKRNEQLEKELAHSRRYAIHYRRHGRL
jgi:hypothetical protein